MLRLQGDAVAGLRRKEYRPVVLKTQKQRLLEKAGADVTARLPRQATEELHAAALVAPLTKKQGKAMHTSLSMMKYVKLCGRNIVAWLKATAAAVPLTTRAAAARHRETPNLFPTRWGILLLKPNPYLKGPIWD